MVERREKNSLFETIQQATYDGLSIWIFHGNNRLSRMCENPKNIPKFNSNYTYVVIDMKRNLSIMGDTPYNSIKAYVWIGSRSMKHQSDFERAMETF